ncbi:MAG TPA: TorF family putative porin [Nitrospiraceae bacterium]|nr:TorF family putative porin [Nitrospiraceae bacterium]
MAASAKDRRLLHRLALVTLVVLWAENAAARQDEIEPVAPPPPPAAAGKLDMGIGLSGTTDYMSRGITQTGSEPAIQGYIEPSYGLGPVLGDAFVNVWSSNVDFGAGFDGVEVDVTGGIKPKLLGPKWSPNIGYVHYFYAPESVSPDYGEIYAKTDYRFGADDKFTLRGLIFFAPDYNQTGETATWIAGGGGMRLWENVVVYAGGGYQFFEDPNAFEQLAWIAGASYYWKSLTFDVRYWDTNLSDEECVVRSGFRSGCDARVVGTVSLDTTWSALFSPRR